MSNGEETTRIGWAEAPGLIVGTVDQRRVRVVAIAGPVGSGKSTLASRLTEQFGARGTDALVLATDHYLPDYEGLAEHERDEPHHADLGLLASHLDALASGRPIDRPVWSFQEHRRVGTERVEPAQVVVCEGIFALREELRETVGLGVFVEAAPSTRWARWEQIETSGDRGMGVERARDHFDRVAEPTFRRYESAYRAVADIVVLNNGA